MPDPGKPFSQRKSDIYGVGPFRFEAGNDFGSGSLAAGGTMTLDVRAHEHNGTKGYYVVLSEAGYDEVQVINRDTDNPITLTINDAWEMPVEPSSMQSDEQSGMYRFTLTNEGSTAIAAGDVILTIEKSAYGADDSARDKATEPPLRSVIRKMTGI